MKTFAKEHPVTAHDTPTLHASQESWQLALVKCWMTAMVCNPCAPMLSFYFPLGLRPWWIPGI